MVVHLSLNKCYPCPVINVLCGNERVPALLDTGAQVPVFTLGQKKIIKLGGVFARKNVSFKGFGGECNGDLYLINVDFGRFRYVDLPVVCPDNLDMAYVLVIPASMFRGFSYTIDDKTHTLKIDTRTQKTDLHLTADTSGKLCILTGI